MKHQRLLPILALLICADMPAPVAAQEFNEIQAVIKPQLNKAKSGRVRRLIQDIAKDRAMSGNRDRGSQPLPLAYTENSEERMGPALDEEVETENVSGAAFNVWLEGSLGHIEDVTAIRGYRGSQNAISIGFDAQLHERLVLGWILNYSGSDITNSFVPGTSQTNAFSTGPYAAVFLTDTLVFSASALHSWTRNSAASGGVTAGWNSTGWSVSGTLTSYHPVGNWLLAPSVGISFDEERERGYVDSASTAFPAVTTRTGALTFGAEATYSHVMENGVTLEPSFGLEAEWTFLDTTTATTTVPADASRFDLTATASLDMGLSESASLSLTSSISGLAKPGFLSYTGGGRFSFSF